MKISEVRKHALKHVVKPVVQEFKSQDFVVAKTKNAIAEILAKVNSQPKFKHHVDIHIGYSLAEKVIESFEVAFKLEVRKKGYADELEVESFQFSNEGDPYFMGTSEQRIQNYIRISEIK